MKRSHQLSGLVFTLVATSLCALPARAAPAPSVRIVESVPEATIYGQPGVQRTQQAWLAMIRGARRSIDIAAFYFSDKPGGALSPVLDALVARAKQGIPIRILVDQLFLKIEGAAVVARLRKVPGITVRVLPVDTLTGGVLHAKYMIVDQDRVFVGSQNWDWRALTEIHEIGARVDDRRFARTFDAVFDFDWHLAAHPDLPKARRLAVVPPAFAPVTREDPVILEDASGSPVVAFPAFSPPALVPDWVTSEQSALLRMIHDCRHVFRLQVMTLSAINKYGPKGWWAPIDAALRDAAARGVQVRIIVADWALHEPMQAYLKSLALMPGITVKFSHLPPSPQGFIPYARVEHAKYAVADDRAAYIGTGNWEKDYFDSTVDASVFIHGTGPASTLIQIFDRDWNGPYVTPLNVAKEYSAPRTH